MPNPKTELLTTKLAAARLGMSYQTLEKWRTLVMGPKYIKVGKKAVRYRAADLEAFIAAGEEGRPHIKHPPAGGARNGC